MKKAILLISLSLVLLLAACGGGNTANENANTSQAQPAESGGDIELGERVFTANCAACHSLEADTVMVGPSLAGVATWGSTMQTGMNAEQYIRESILEPDSYLTEGFQDLMPKTYGSTLSSEELEGVIAFLLTQK